MARQKVSFVATRTVERPATVQFKTKSGNTVPFKAFETAGKRWFSVFARRILTFDEEDDFKQIPGLTVLHPKDIKI